MAQLVANSFTHLHPILNHFPIALFVMSIGLDLLAFWRAELRQSAWLALLIGALLAIPTFVTGTIAHFPYENSPAIDAIEAHQKWGLLTTLLLLVLLGWRAWSRRRGKDAGGTLPYLLVGIVTLGLLTVAGMTGGDLVYQLGVGVSTIVK